MHSPSGQGHKRQQRGQSAPLGLLLVFALVIAATTLIVALGAGSISDTQGQLDSERTEKALTQLDSQAALVALGSSQVQTVDISAAGSSNYVVDEYAGSMTLSYENQTDGTTTTIFSEDLGRIIYEGDSGQTIAYQGGGVWRSDGSGGSVMVSPPEFHYRDATLTLPLVIVNSSGTVDNRAVISQSNNTQWFPNESIDSDFSNPLENARVEVTVTSEYYQAWGEYFETRTEGDVEYDDASQQVTLTLVTPLENTEINSASASLSGGGTFTISGSAPSLCSSDRRNYTDSYDSSGSTGYCGQDTGSEGDLVYGGEIDISSGTGGGGGVRNNIYGDVISGGRVVVTNGNGNGPPFVFGNINHSGACNPSPSQCESRIRDGGTRTQISGIEETPPIDGIVRTQIDAVEDSNDNGATNNITATNQLDYGNSGTSDTVELGSGTYYLNDISVDPGDTVLLNTTDGDITIAVEEDIHLRSDATINVTGEGGNVEVYVQATGTSTDEVDLEGGSEIINNGDDAPQFRVFGPSNLTVQVGDGGTLATYTGVVFSPPGTAGSSSVTLDGGVIYGGVVTGTTLIDNGPGGSIHYDEALEGLSVLERGDSVVRVTYIHASTNEVRIEEG
jgi:hypothetical protein